MTGGGYNKGPSNVQAAQATAYTPMVNQMTTEKGTGVAIDNDGLTRDKKVLSLLPYISTGPAASRITGVQNLVAELFGNKTLAQVYDQRNADPAAWNVVNKLLGQAATANFRESGAGGEAGQTRVSGLLYQIGMSQLAANTAINKAAIQQMLQYDVAQRTFRVQRDGVDFPAARAAHRDLTNFDATYNTLPGHDQNAAMGRYMAAMDDKGNIDSQRLRPGADANPIQLNSPEDLTNLPNGTYIRTHDGRVGRKRQVVGQP